MESQGNRVQPAVGARIATLPESDVDARPPSTRLRSLPPLDPTMPAGPPAGTRSPSVSGTRPIPKPILASECLRDDIAPLEPFPLASRVVLAIAGAAAIGGATALLKTFPQVALGTFAGGAVTAVAAAVPSYRWRSVAGAVGGLTVVGSLTLGEPYWGLRAVSAIVLGAALFTRATYRAHRGARIAIGVGIALFAAAAALSLGPQLSSRIAALVMGLVALASLLGFMGEQTTGGSAGWAVLALTSASASIAVAMPVAFVSLLAVAVLFAATVSSAASLFTLVASVIAPGERAREHRASPPPPVANDT